MAKFEKIENTKGTYRFTCPGCNVMHLIWTAKEENSEVIPWGFNGDINSPTITPSILVQYPMKDKTRICHSFIKNGMIQYLPDCTHHLAGQTIELPEITEIEIKDIN